MLDAIPENQIYEQIPDYRKKSADACKNEIDRKRSLAASYLLYQCLNEHGIDINSSPSFSKVGKMYFPKEEMFYVNLSHADDYAVCACDCVEIGADVEGVREYRASVINRVCSEKEKGILDAIADPTEKNKAFSELWTQKESAVKLTGVGIAALLSKGVNDEEIYTKTYYPCEKCFLSISSYCDKFCGEIAWFPQKPSLTL